MESNAKKNSSDDGQQHDIAIVGGGMVGIALAASLEKGHPPDPRVSTVAPATISFLKDVGAWKYIEQQRHGYFDKMQVRRSENFDLIRIPKTATLIKLTRYEGKLAVMSFGPAGHASTGKIDLWVLVDAAKHEWSNQVSALDLGITKWFLQAFCITDAVSALPLGA
ncbi:hypothetical protein ARALYDRAFT_342565 [Arabidopsis lyrata subsp. lyrata]|uniref:F-box associated beta-propeller type 3 domain-containing protein n=1 Tax=Arabidopsis lyrata subsp. lyrata TaxID=81972 RepID=D7L491_ARALL|nr:hypothetical protein ARALYDRAFT_342565 [Arabidopsis lyrata subsp. lyrata]